MRTARTTAIAGALVFFGLLAPQPMAAQPEPSALTTLDIPACSRIGKYHKCPLLVPPDAASINAYVALTDKQFEALKKAPVSPKQVIEGAKKALEAAPDSTK